MDQQQLESLVKKILAGRASEWEKKLVKAHFAAHPDHGTLKQQMFPSDEWNMSETKQLPTAVEERILRSIIGENISAQGAKRPPIVKYLWRVAAAAVLIAVMFTTVKYLNSDLRNNAAFQTVTTEPGEMKLVTLTDGSRVRLNGASSLRFPKTFNKPNREVHLDGEAFFEVSADAAHPFIIYSPSINTTVLGTTFNIRSSSHDQSSEVAVATGKVKVTATNNENKKFTAVLLPGHKASYSLQQSRGMVIGKIPVASISAWKDRGFYYERSPLSQILADITRTFGTKFHIATSSVLRCTYSATFKNMDAAQILQTLSMMSDVQFIKRNNLIEVSGKPCN